MNKDTYGKQDVKEVVAQTTSVSDFNKTRIQTIEMYLDKNKTEFIKALGTEEFTNRFIRIVMTAVTLNPELQKCTAGSIVAQALTSAQLKLDPNTPLGQAWLIPYYDKKRDAYFCQFQLGYKGVLDLFYRHPLARICIVKEVRATDHFEIYEGSRLEVIHNYDPKLPKAKRGDIIGFYCIAELNNGARNVEYAHISDLLAHGKRYSKSFDSPFSPWQTAQAQMCKKTLALMTLNYMPMSVDVGRALAQDGRVKADLIPGVDVLDLPSIDITPDDKELDTGVTNEKTH